MEKITFKDLSNAADTVATLEKMPLYYSGDDTFVMSVEAASYEDFLAVSNEITLGCADDDICSYTIGENSFIWVRKSHGYDGAYYIPCRKQVRMVKRSSGDMIPTYLTERTSFAEKKKLIQLAPDGDAGNFGMGYIICLGDGHFIIYDGNGDFGGMAEKILDHLLSNTPEGRKPVIDAWLVTHVHWDHVAAMFDFAKKYADRVEVRNLLANFPAHHNIYIKERGPNTDFYARWWPKICGWFSEAKIWKLHTGQCFTVGDVKIEVLLTHEDVYPATLYPNDTSTVTMMYINGKKIFFPGDIEYEIPCKLIHDMYGSYLKSDYYQVAHHGWNSNALYFYDDVDAPNVLWPLPQRTVGNGENNRELVLQFPATQRLISDWKENKKQFFRTEKEDDIFEF